METLDECHAVDLETEKKNNLLLLKKNVRRYEEDTGAETSAEDERLQNDSLNKTHNKKKSWKQNLMKVLKAAL